WTRFRRWSRASSAKGSNMAEEMIIPVPPEWEKRAYITPARYRAMYAESLADPEKFWPKEAETFSWRSKWRKVKDTRFTSPVSIRWFDGGKLNITENCLDRHLAARGDQTAYIWEGDDPGESKRITYRELYEQVCRLANVLK